MKHFFFLFISILFICMIEEIPLAVNPNYSMFKIIFEVVSAYGRRLSFRIPSLPISISLFELPGTVGLSLGYGSMPYSFSGAWSDGSKFILILVMILGKQRFVIHFASKESVNAS